MNTIIQKPSPNFSAGRGIQKPEIIVIHIMEGSLSGTDSWFANPISKVSSHYGVGFKGEIHQYVKDEDTAWTQGFHESATFKLHKLGVNPNSYCLSIENEGTDLMKAPEAQINSIVDVIRTLSAKWSIPIDRDHIIGHYEVDPVRRPFCPSPDRSIMDIIVKKAQIGIGAVKSKESILAKLDELRKEIESY